jgi:hypothetical protein
MFVLLRVEHFLLVRIKMFPDGKEVTSSYAQRSQASVIDESMVYV